MKFPEEIFYGIKNKKIIKIIQSLPREDFIPQNLRDSAYIDGPLPIGDGQTISQPSLVAYMTELLKLKENEKVLEIGTGSGYQTAVLSHLASKVYTIEIVENLYNIAKKRLDNMGIENVKFKLGSGYGGWEEEAPFNKILVTAAPPIIPKSLIDQLALDGRMVVPVGERGMTQVLKLIVKTKKGIVEKDISYVRFVSMI